MTWNCKKNGKTIPAIFEQDGEDKFRQLEHLGTKKPAFGETVSLPVGEPFWIQKM